MTTPAARFLERARELAFPLWAFMTIDEMVDVVAAALAQTRESAFPLWALMTIDEMVDVVAAALAQTRDDALEEADQITSDLEPPAEEDPYVVLREVHDRIVALKSRAMKGGGR